MRKIWLMFLLSIAACEKPAEPVVETATPRSAADSPVAPSSQPAPAAAAAVPSAAASAGGLTWTDAKPLVRRAPKNSMRAAEYGIEGDDRAELSVFYFGPDPGEVVEPNVTRWLGQLQQPDGSDTAKKAKRSESKVAGMTVSFVEAQGTFSGGMAMPGAQAPQALEDAMLLGAIAAGPKGAVFFKLVGPRAAVERARPGFQAMLSSLRPE
jgi:hypothetical protein